jgi:glycosyltransferase involved in cell wall biosynthesis
MKKAKALGLFSTLLGNKATARLLQATLSSIPQVDAHVEFLNIEDYGRFPAPRWARLTNPWHSQYLFRRKFSLLLDKPVDLIMINCWEFAVPLAQIARSIPVALLLDCVPSTVHEQLRRRGETGLRREISFHLHHHAFRRAIRNFRFFFPMGSDCAEALVKRYGVQQDRCFITLAPQDTEQWQPSGAWQIHQPFRLLFVGNDFQRKGGFFLLELYSRYLGEHCSLVIVSNDSFDSSFLPSGVTWIRGKSKHDLLTLYQDSDLFVFPTLQDYMPQVLAEALAAGLPAIATDVGSISDLIQHNSTGYLMPFGAPMERWAQTILEVARDARKLGMMRQQARQFAEDQLSLRRFEDGIRSGVMHMLAGSP